MVTKAHNSYNMQQLNFVKKNILFKISEAAKLILTVFSIHLIPVENIKFSPKRFRSGKWDFSQKEILKEIRLSRDLTKL